MPKTKTPHPFDPLTSREVEFAASVISEAAGLDRSAWFETIALKEPDRRVKSKGKGRNGKAGNGRKAFVCCYEPKTNKTYEGTVDLATGKLESWAPVAGMMARIVSDEFVAGGVIAKKDPAVIAALKKRGITDLDRVLIEPWAAGNFGIEGEEGKRLAYGHCWLGSEDGENPYAQPIANLHPVVDLQHMKVLRVDDFGVVPLPPDTSRIRLEKGLREDLKPLEITQPEGPSFTIEGNELAWQKWRIRTGFNMREGLILYDIGYEDGGRVRPIMNRASLAEMVVPYGDPTGGNFRRNAFDCGEYGVGKFVDSLELGCDCLGVIHYQDVTAHDWKGKARTVKNGICIHEEDHGILWKFTNTWSGQSSVARSRRLVISSLMTIGNYVYGFFWYFYQDGTIGVEVKATGIPFPTAIAPGKTPEHGSLIAPQIDSHVHQHVFSYRFEMCVDGEKNAVREVDFEAMPKGPDNRHGNGIRIAERAMLSERDAQSVMDMGRARYWKVINPNLKNTLGQHPGYKLVPGVNAMPFNHPDSPIGRRAGFMYKHFWATAYDPEELYPAGWYPNQHEGGDGLPRWVKADRPLENEPLVVWYTLNYHHLPRPEDWPVQPVVYAGFHWMPVGFFERNPALDVPQPEKKAHCC